MIYSPELQAALDEFTKDMPRETYTQRQDVAHAETCYAVGWLQGENERLRDQIAQLERDSAS